MIEEIETLKIGDHPMTWQRAIQTPKPYKYAIVKHIPREVGEWVTENGKRVFKALPFAPDTVPIQDRPVGDGKGENILITNEWWKHIRAINNDAGYAYDRAIKAMLINQTYNMETNDPPAHAESITCGGNFVAYDYETTNHIRLVTRANPYGLNPFINNWLIEPYLYLKAIAISKTGVMINPGQNIDAYFPYIGEMWLHKKYVEMFPEGNYNYRLVGCNVYDGNQPLLTVTKDRVRIFHRAGWSLQTVGVIPPK